MTQLISAIELKQQLQSQPNKPTDLIILDCRADLANPQSAFQLYQDGHIPNALHAHLENDLSGGIIPGKTGRHPLPIADNFEKTLRNWGISSESTVVVYDQANGMYAARAWWLLKWAGVESVKLLNGGLQQWLNNDGELDQSIPQVSPSAFKIAPKLEWTVLADTLAVLTEDTALLDARALERYQGKIEPLDPKAGHIPRAQNADFTKNLTESGLFKSQAELAQRFASLSNSEVICYCGSGVTACHNIFAIYEAGFAMPKLYPGSWSEWVTRPEHNIATGTEGVIL